MATSESRATDSETQKVNPRLITTKEKQTHQPVQDLYNKQQYLVLCDCSDSVKI